MEIEFVQGEYTVKNLHKCEWNMFQNLEDAILCDPDHNIHADSNQESYKRDGFTPKEPQTWRVVQCENWEYTGDDEDSVSCPISLIGDDDEEYDSGFLEICGFREIED